MYSHLLILIVIASNLNAMVSEPDLHDPSCVEHSEFQPLPIVTALAHYGAHEFDIDPLPNIYKINESIGFSTTALTLSPLGVSDVLCHAKSEEQKLSTILHKIYDGAPDICSTCTILLFPTFFMFSYGAQI